MTYEELLKNKRRYIHPLGFEAGDMPDTLYPFQQFATTRALKHGRFALFEECGLGKTRQFLIFADRIVKKENKPVLILCPLAVSGQTIKEGENIGIEVKKFNAPGNADIRIANYEQLENINVDEFCGIVLDECFAPDTKIQVWRENKLREVHIKECLIGDKVLNCTGIDTIKAIKTKKIPYAIRLTFNGKSITSSPRHPYFTQRGWVAAKEIQANDFIIPTDKAMRILRGGFSDNLQRGYSEKILRDILLCEMENDTAGNKGRRTQPGSGSKKREKQSSMVQNGCSQAGIGQDNSAEPDAEFRNQAESICYSESHETPTFSSWGKWAGNDIATAINEGCIVRQLDSGICYITGEKTTGLPDSIQSRLSQLGNENSDRAGWVQPLFEEGTGHKEGFKTDFFRVESFEVLEQGSSELGEYRDEKGELYFYDLEIERHPSFTINGALVHNSSILKNFDGVYRNKLISSFRRHHYRLCCTATPSPNDIMELGNHTEFLGIMPRNEMLAMYFVHDGGETNKWRLKGHAQDVFWQFVSSWALVVSKPSSIGFNDTGYTLPPLKYHTHEIKTALKGSKLFNDTAVSAIDFNAELRRTMAQRMDLAAEIAAGVTGQNVIWIKQNEEGQQLLKRIPGAIEVQGSDSIEYKEEMLLAFAAGQIKNLITKTKICGYGMNWQNCSNTTFAAPDFSFEQTYQGIRRFYRFGNPNEVNANFIITDTMQNILSEFKRKQAQHEEMQNRTEKFVHNYQQADEFKQTQNLKQFKLPSWI